MNDPRRYPLCRPGGTAWRVLPACMAAVAAMLAGCASTRADVTAGERFEAASPYARGYAVSAPAACSAARRALLSQGYRVTAAPELLEGRKLFGPTPGSHARLVLHVVCAPNGSAGETSTVFVSAVQDTYALKTTSKYATVGVAALGSVSLPIGRDVDSMVNVGSETIGAHAFYGRFFDLLEQLLAERPDDGGA